MKRSLKTLYLVLAIWLLSTLAVAGLAFHKLDLYRYWYLINYGEKTYGTIINSDDRTRVITYQFEVNGTSYEDSFTATRPGNIGRKIIISYDTLDPSYHLLGEITDSLKGLVVTFVIVALIPTAVFSVVIFLLYKLRLS